MITRKLQKLDCFIYFKVNAQGCLIQSEIMSCSSHRVQPRNSKQNDSITPSVKRGSNTYHGKLEQSSSLSFNVFRGSRSWRMLTAISFIEDSIIESLTQGAGDLSSIPQNKSTLLKRSSMLLQNYSNNSKKNYLSQVFLKKKNEFSWNVASKWSEHSILHHLHFLSRLTIVLRRSYCTVLYLQVCHQTSIQV